MLTTSRSARTALPPALVVLVAACALLTGAVALAGPAAAIEDPRRPTAELTHGPSCGPGVVRVTVTNGSEPHRVALVFDDVREQASADLGIGEQAELTSADVEWGTTVDVSLTVTAPDGTVGEPLEFGTYTRPSAEDCAAVTPPTPETTPGSTPPPAPSSTATTTPGSPSSTSSTPSRPGTPTAPGTPTQQPSSTAPAPGTPRSTPPASTSS
ncbi:hypothetical protein, partial [Modestobacter versicolor]